MASVRLAGTPPDIVDLLNREINAALADPAIKARLGELGAIAITGNAREFAAMLSAETDRWRKVVELSGQKKEVCLPVMPGLVPGIRVFLALPATKKDLDGRDKPDHDTLLIYWAQSLDKIPALRADDLLIHRLFEAIEPSLFHAELHLISSVLPAHRLRCGFARQSLAHGQGHGSARVGSNRSG